MEKQTLEFKLKIFEESLAWSKLLVVTTVVSIFTSFFLLADLLEKIRYPSLLGIFWLLLLISLFGGAVHMGKLCKQIEISFALEELKIDCTMKKVQQWTFLGAITLFCVMVFLSKDCLT